MLKGFSDEEKQHYRASLTVFSDNHSTKRSYSHKKALIKKNVDAEVIDNYLDIVAQCEFARFAPGDPAAMMDKIFTEASEAINKLDSIIK